MSSITRGAVIALGFVALSASLYFGVYKSQLEANQNAEQHLQTLQTQNAQMEQFRPRLKELDAQLVILQQKMEAGRRIVPDEKESPQFMRWIEAEAHQSGVEIRRYTARPIAQREYFAEAPFELELDGSYLNLRSFFERVSRLDRIVNISGLQLASTRNPQDAKTRRTYAYAPGESVVATCIATAFYGHAAPAAPPPAGKAAGQN